MKRDNRFKNKSKCRIDKVDFTNEQITGRGGAALFSRYIEQIGIYPHLMNYFGKIRKSKKGIEIFELFKQIFCFLMDGASRHIVYFDHLKKDTGYAKAIETEQKDMASSHTIKRFFKRFSSGLIFLFRQLERRLFLWRLDIAKPDIIILDMDVMPMDNDEAEKREGVNPAYKNKKGFAPLQMVWGRYIVDAIFRSGEKHSNHGNDAKRMIARAVKAVRTKYSADVPIIFRIDSGFFDQKLFRFIESLPGVGYICTGRLYNDISCDMDMICDNRWQRLKKDKIWEFVEFGNRRASWSKFRRALFCRPMSEDGQMVLPFERPSSIIYTSLGMGGKIDTLLKKAGHNNLLNPDGIIRCYHDRGKDELVFRAFKEFGDQKLPFKSFDANAAFYHCMVIAFFLWESFKQDVCGEVIPLESYPDTFRRILIDIAAKIVSHSGKIIIKIAKAVFERLDFGKLWANCNNPPRLCPA